MNYISLIFLTITLLFSCSNKNDFESNLEILGIELSDSYEVDSITQFGFSDWTLEASVKISEKNKNEIITKINSRIKCPTVNSNDEYYNQYHIMTDTIYTYKAKYFYGITIPRYVEFKNGIDQAGYETYDLELDTIKNKLYFIYNYE